MVEPSSSPAIDLGRLAPGLGKTCGSYLASYRTALEDRIRAGEGGVPVASRHAAVLDGLLGALWCAADAAARAAGSAPAGRVALAAVGGYGRGLVALHSDVDVLFLCEDASDPHVERLAEGVLYPLWDLGLSIGHAVRGSEETLRLAREDIRTATTLLDLRRVAGDAGLIQELTQGGRQKVFEPALEELLDALEKDTTARHERFGGSLFLLEPEVKLGIGGLRDLDVAIWAARARWGGVKLEELVRTGAILAREVGELENAREMLWRVRNLLHLRAGRRNDRLTFEDQEEIAKELGFVDGVTLGVEQFMQAYYRHARTVAQLRERIVARARPSVRRSKATTESFGDGVMIFDGHVTMEDSAALGADPALALRLYKHVVRRELPPYPFARDAIARAAADPEWRQRLRAAPESAKLFLALLTHVGEAPVKRGSILGELHELGLMLAMIPEFEPVTGRVQHDVYHVYTVDVHSVAAIDRLRSIMRGEWAAQSPLTSSLAAETTRREPLFLGVLLHDIGKAHGKDHSKKGAVMAGPIAERLGLEKVDVDHVVWLVLEHLSLYHWAMRRDLSDPATIEEVSKLVGTNERMRDLHLLTVADLSTTNPNAMTSWKARMLDDLYVAVVSALEGDAPPPAQRRADAIRAQVRAAIAQAAEPGAPEMNAFIEGMPHRYLLAFASEAILAHARAARDRGDAAVHVAALPGPSEDVTELAVATDDRPGLLADITAALAASRLAVGAAQIYTRPREGKAREAFDVFHVRRASGGAPDAAAIAKLRRDLDDLIAGRISASDLLAKQPRTPAWAVRRAPEVATEVRVDNALSPRFTVVDVFTRDRVGLLHAIARTLHEQGLSIALSKVNTEGLKVADVFYVEEPGGGKVRDPERLIRLPIVLRDAIAALDEPRSGTSSLPPRAPEGR